MAAKSVGCARLSIAPVIRNLLSASERDQPSRTVPVVKLLFAAPLTSEFPAWLHSSTDSTSEEPLTKQVASTEVFPMVEVESFSLLGQISNRVRSPLNEETSANSVVDASTKPRGRWT